MAYLAWVMMALAVWHFCIFIDDKIWGGIVGAFIAAIAGALVFGLVIHGFDPPSRADTTIVTALEAIPGALLGIGAAYLYGARKAQAAPRTA
jgi:glucose uptake protein GlcU